MSSILPLKREPRRIPARSSTPTIPAPHGVRYGGLARS
jgi:hypothetical protein